jgi:adenylate cyclase class 2
VDNPNTLLEGRPGQKVHSMKASTLSSAKRNLEIEVKLKIVSPQKLRTQIKMLGFHELCHREFEDNWLLDFPEKSLFKKRCLLRLRQFHGKSVLTFKGPKTAATHLKIREELETEVSDRATCHQILKRLGFVPAFRYQKYRSMFVKSRSGKSKRVVISIDETPIGNYLEIEGQPETIRMLAAKLGYAPRNFITQSYLELYTRHKPRPQDRKMIFKK